MGLKIKQLVVILNRIMELVRAPIMQFPLVFGLMAFSLFIPELYIWPGLWLPIKIGVCRVFSTLTISVFVSYVICLICTLIRGVNRLVGSILVYFFSILIFVVSLIDCYLYQQFGMHLGINAFQLIQETSMQESKEFINAYLLSWKFLLAFLLFVLFVVVIVKFDSILSKYIYKSKISRFLTLLFSAYLLFSCFTYIKCAPYYFTFQWEDNINAYGPKPLIKETFYFKFRNSLLQFINEKQSFDKCSQSQRNLSVTFNSDEGIKNIVLIIGESFNKYHSSLYGYNLDTNPQLSKLDGLLVYRDVISSINRTSQSFKNFLSLYDVDDACEWCDKPLILSILKDAGYNVVFWSNQFTQSLDSDQWEASCGFFFHPRIKDYLFSATNQVKFSYDGELIHSFESARPELAQDSLNFYIIHLYGQHVYAHMRFPKDSSYFQLNDYKSRIELNNKEKQQVADYDNATRYNDYVVSEVIRMFRDEDSIIIYFSDHGDEVNDFRPHIGRAYDLNESGAPGLHCQLDIPFIVYMTDIFKGRHSELSERIKRSVDRPYMTDDLPFMILDLTGIKTIWNNDSKSLINDKFDSTRKRMIKDYSFNGAIDYDAVCEGYGIWEIGY